MEKRIKLYNPDGEAVYREDEIGCALSVRLCADNDEAYRVYLCGGENDVYCGIIDESGTLDCRMNGTGFKAIHITLREGDGERVVSKVRISDEPELMFHIEADDTQDKEEDREEKPSHDDSGDISALVKTVMLALLYLKGKSKDKK